MLNCRSNKRYQYIKDESIIEADEDDDDWYFTHAKELAKEILFLDII